jgi:hypothetical protein
MTAKEEAVELYDKFFNSAESRNKIGLYDEYLHKYNAKQCALIAIEFASDQFEKYCCAEMGLHWTKDNESSDGSRDHFRYIKEEIEKL